MPGMPGSPPPGPFVYQLRVVPRGVCPLIWRRLLVRSDSSIADLHATLRFALGWSDEYLTALVVHSIASTREPPTEDWLKEWSIERGARYEDQGAGGDRGG